jgi:hypothetical protein
MINTIINAIICASLVLTIASCSSSSSTSTSTPSSSLSPSPSSSARDVSYPFMIGKLEVIGNNPSAQWALRVDETHSYLLRTPNDSRKKITSHLQGLVKVYYSGRQERGTDHYLDVANIEDLTPKK